MGVETDSSGNVWYTHPNGYKELLIPAKDTCGVKFFSTGINDVFRPACVWHDNAYTNRAFFEERGWNRRVIDKYFLKLCLLIADNRSLLVARAHLYYGLVRSFGWLYFYRYKPYIGDQGNGRETLHEQKDG